MNRLLRRSARVLLRAADTYLSRLWIDAGAHMTWFAVNGTEIDCTVTGTGEPVLLVAGTATSGRVWHLHQVSALAAAGFQVITFDGRDVRTASAGDAGPIDLADLVHDAVELLLQELVERGDGSLQRRVSKRSDLGDATRGERVQPVPADPADAEKAEARAR